MGNCEHVRWQAAWDAYIKAMQKAGFSDDVAVYVASGLTQNSTGDRPSTFPENLNLASNAR